MAVFQVENKQDALSLRPTHIHSATSSSMHTHAIADPLWQSAAARAHVHPTVCASTWITKRVNSNLGSRIFIDPGPFALAQAGVLYPW